MTYVPLQTMDVTSLKAVITELQETLLPSRFEQAQQTDSHTIQIGVRTLKGLKWLELSWRADAARLVIVEPSKRVGSQSTLARQIQHGLRQMALVEIRQKGFERVVQFGLSPRPGEAIQRTLVLELMGRHSNFFLLNNQHRIIAIGRQVKDHQSRIRPIGNGDAYIDPPLLRGYKPTLTESINSWKKNLCLIPSQKLLNALQQSYQGISPALALQIADEEEETARTLINSKVLEITNKQWEDLYCRWCLWLKRVEEKNFSLRFDGPTPFRVWGEIKTNTKMSKELCLKLGSYYTEILESKQILDITNEIRESLIKAKKNQNNHLEEQECLLDKSNKNKDLQEKADNLLCEKEPGKKILEEAQKLYIQAKKLRRSIPAIKQRILHHQQKLQFIQETEAFLEEFVSNKWETQDQKIKGLLELQEETKSLIRSNEKIKKRRIQSNRRTQQLNTPKPLQLTSPNGLVIQVGRNHRQNEWISLRQSRNGDIWFHAQECPGSHVVLKASSKVAEESDLQIAIDLAAYFSKAKGNKSVPVIMASTNDLKRISGGDPGTVSHRNSKILWGEPSRGIKYLETSSHGEINSGS